MDETEPLPEALVDRMATHAGRIHDPDLREQQYASHWLNLLWTIAEELQLAAAT